VAEDHFDVLAKAILHARGEQSLVFGESTLNQDFLVRELRIYDKAEEAFPSLPPLTRALLSAYAEGVNLYMTQNRDRVPAWAKPITGVDLLAHCRRTILMDFAMDLGPLWKERQIKNEGIERGSNMWAIGRGRSASGRGLLLANPHLLWDGTFLFHEVHLTVPGQINMSGAALVGFPVIGMGFNDPLAQRHERLIEMHVQERAIGGNRLVVRHALRAPEADVRVRTEPGDAELLVRAVQTSLLVVP